MGYTFDMDELTNYELGQLIGEGFVYVLMIGGLIWLAVKKKGE